MTGKTAKPKASRAPVVTPPKSREPTPAESDAIRQALDNQARRPSRALVAVGATEVHALTINNPHTDTTGWMAHLTDTFGTSSEAFANQSFARVATAVAQQKKAVTETEANAALALMGAIAPANELEAVIGEQIIAAHAASLDFLQRARLNAGEYRDTAVAYANAATKLTRTMGGLVETLAKLRSGGRQRIEVVYVNGPAVFGDNAQTVIAGGGLGESSGNVDQPHASEAVARIAAAARLPMRSQDPEGRALPVASREGPEAMQDARWDQPGGAEGQAQRALSQRNLHAGAARGSRSGPRARKAG